MKTAGRPYTLPQRQLTLTGRSFVCWSLLRSLPETRRCSMLEPRTTETRRCISPYPMTKLIRPAGLQQRFTGGDLIFSENLENTFQVSNPMFQRKTVGGGDRGRGAAAEYTSEKSLLIGPSVVCHTYSIVWKIRRVHVLKK